MAAPLTKLLRKGVLFDWTDAQQESFETLKTVLTEALVLISQNLERSSRQKSYSDLKRYEIEYSVGDLIFLKVLPCKKLDLPLELDCIHDVFHVSMLRRYRSDPTYIVPIKEIEVRPDLTFEKELIQILDHDVKVMRRKSIPPVKVLWRNHSTEEATWELEDAMHQ
ncbi:uncharacterized protein LOC108466188 [Gossypium arboreum]|uniref:uncharacterized protein LOC108466188 n=1 Tax=Gossypium arboreum TaxID=29729 RepID=UPI0008193712|nr:uncharacterized protein LOC108466188 [Gossypium arboreum]